ncbi:hypothetical protein EJB05_35096, partial [Eragrostis curvula]
MDRSAAGDRLSKLQDPVLGRILSFLPAKEAARAALLSSRWRDVFAGVHTLVLEEPERPIREPKDRYGSPPPDPDQPPPFSNAISAALLASNRRGGGTPLRIAKEHYSRTDSSLVDQWVSFALQQAGADGLDLDLRLCCHRSLCRRSYSLQSAGKRIDDETPRPPRDEVVSDGEEAVCEVESPPRADAERLITGCPRLVDLTLEACDAVTTFSVLDASVRLRRLALRCCHNLVTVAVDSSELRAFEYRGAVPDNDFLTLHGGCPKVVSCNDDDNAVVAAVSRILEHAPNLEALSLVFHPEEDDRWSHEYRTFKDDDLLDAHHLDYNPHSTLPVPRVAIPCLGSHVKKINLVHYQGGRAQRTLAKFLLSNAPVMQELCCELAEGPFWTQTQLMREIKTWVVSQSANTHIS